MLSFTVYLDYTFYGQFVLPFVKFVQFNLEHSALYGVHAWFWYLPVFAGLLCTWLPFYIVGVVKSRNFIILSSTLISIGLLSVVKHKEIRFILPVAQLSVPFIARGLYSTYNSKYFKHILVLTAIPHILIGAYLNIFHQRGPMTAVNYLRHEMIGHNTRPLFLMPCHSTPYFAYFHDPIDLDFLRCDPVSVFGSRCYFLNIVNCILTKIQLSTSLLLNF